MQVQIKCTIHEMEKMILFFIFGVFKCHFQQYFSYIVATSFSGGGSRSTGKRYHLWLRIDQRVGQDVLDITLCEKVCQ
jgi:hypothetical protein